MNRRDDGPNGKLHGAGHTRNYLNRARRARRAPVGPLCLQVEAARVAFYRLPKFDRHQYNILTGRINNPRSVGGQFPAKARQLAQDIIRTRMVHAQQVAMRRRAKRSPIPA